jgi:flagellar hook protein FlgE
MKAVRDGIESGAFAPSKVDLAREFIGLTNAPTRFSAIGPVITTVDDLLEVQFLIVRKCSHDLLN